MRAFLENPLVQAEERAAVHAANDLPPQEAGEDGDAFNLRRAAATRDYSPSLITRQFVDVGFVSEAPDPVRPGETPSRHPEMYVRFDVPTYFETPEDNLPESGITHEVKPSPLATMPIGLMMFPDGENRRLDDGRHA